MAKEFFWHPVDEELPKERTDVLATIEGIDRRKHVVCVGWYNGGGEWFIPYDTVIFDVIAWMDLPDPWYDERGE